MSSGEDDVTEGTGEKRFDRSLFVRILKDYKEVFEKSKLPSSIVTKEKAWKNITDEYANTSGQKVTSVQLKKMLYNLKTSVKKKYDMKATGNKPIKFKEWESDFLDMLHTGENPVFSKVPGSISVGVGISGEGPIPAKKGSLWRVKTYKQLVAAPMGLRNHLIKRLEQTKLWVC